MRDIFKLGGVLFTITAIAALLISFTNEATADIIAAQQGTPLEIYQPVLPEATEFELREDIDLEDTRVVAVYEGTANGDVVGYGIQAAANGYGGPVNVYVGISTDGVVTGFEAGSHTETPGIGDIVTDEEFQAGFVDISVNSAVEDEVDTVSGATMTTRAAIVGVQSAIDVYNENLQ